MSYAALMARITPLPSPWVHTETVEGNARDALERVLGANIQAAQLDENDTHDGQPISRKAWLYYGFKWIKILNSESLIQAILRLQTFDGSNYTVSAISFPQQAGHAEITGSSIRTIPIAAIAAAYSLDMQTGSANLKTFLHVLQEVADEVDPLAPLPKADSTQKFAALVARQYRHIEKHEAGVYVPQRMADINDRPLATVQRWITKARKEGFLPPIATGRKPNA